MLGEPIGLVQQRLQAKREYNDGMTAKEKKDWCDSGIKGTAWCQDEIDKGWNYRTKKTEGLMF